MKLFIKEKEFTLPAIFAMLIGLLLVFGTIFYFIGRHAQINNSVVSALAQAELDVNDRYLEKDAENAKLANEIKEKQTTLNDMKSYNENKTKLDKEFNDINADVTSLKGQVDILNNTIKEKNAELNRVTANVTKAKGAPKVLPAGNFTVGKDLPEGRYSVTGTSNFFVDSSDGRNKVNAILGGGSWGVECYVCNLENGDTIEAHSKCTYTPIA